MNNNYEFTKLNEDGLTVDIFCSLSEKRLKGILDDYFNELEFHLTNFANTFKRIFNEKDYDEHYYQAKSLIELLNDIKIILNILYDVNKNE